jgi:hypothetical protein
LLQILAWFGSQEFAHTRLRLLELDQHPKVTPFYGLGQLKGPQLAALFPSRVPVTAERFGGSSEKLADFHFNITRRPERAGSIVGRIPGPDRWPFQNRTSVAARRMGRSDFERRSLS